MENKPQFLILAEEIHAIFLENNLPYEAKCLQKDIRTSATSIEKCKNIGSLLFTMKYRKEVEVLAGQKIIGFLDLCMAMGICISPTSEYNIIKKEFIIDGCNFNNIKEFYNEIGDKLVVGNWQKNWAASLLCCNSGAKILK